MPDVVLKGEDARKIKEALQTVIDKAKSQQAALEGVVSEVDAKLDDFDRRLSSQGERLAHLEGSNEAYAATTRDHNTVLITGSHKHARGEEKPSPSVEAQAEQMKSMVSLLIEGIKAHKLLIQVVLQLLVLAGLALNYFLDHSDSGPPPEPVPSVSGETE